MTGFIADNTAAWADIRKMFDEAPPWLQAPETANGPGATLEATENLRAWLPLVFESYGITSILDAACGDWSWFQHIDLGDIRYIGWDVEPKQIQENRERFSHRDAQFDCVSLLTAPAVPPVDLILCRHALIHFTTGYINDVLAKFKASGSKYLLASNFPGADNEFVYNPQEWAWAGYCERPVNLQAPPFSLTRKLDAFQETTSTTGVISQPHELALFQIGHAAPSGS